MNSIPVKKNKEYEVKIIDNGFQGEGIAKIDGFTIIVQNAIKDEDVRIKILKVTSSIAYAKVIEFIKPSEYRTQADCSTYNRCGGCSLRHVDYNETLRIKKHNVENCFRKVNLNNVKINDCIGMNDPYYYRNKLIYPVGVGKDGQPVMGVFAERTHEIVPTIDCKIQNKVCQNIANDIFEFMKKNSIPAYNEVTREGSIRHIVIKIGIKTNEIMVVLVTNTKSIKKENELVTYITEKYEEIKTVVKNVNSKNTNVILGQENEVLFGSGYIYDYLGECKFKISPMSFYQVNPVQTEVLYGKAVEGAKLSGSETVLDLYCGIGTIGLFASKNVKKLYGIEIVPQAIEDAKENANLNNVQNAEFYAGDVEVVLPQVLEKSNITPDVVFVDPPRKGLDENTIKVLNGLGSKKIVYVSCNPATLARDLVKLQEKYEIVEVTPVDMFPFTHHCEVVSVLRLK